MSKIKVALRVRPISTREKDDGHVVVVGLEGKSAVITDIKVPERPSADSRQRLRQFDFDHVFWLSKTGNEAAAQSSVFDEMGPALEKSILSGHNATVLCYGQSGTGKTHTMLGTKEDPGLIPRLCQGLWEKLKLNETRKSTFLFEVSFMEIYREKVRDLLTQSEKVLKLREHPQLGPHVQGLTRIQINEEWEFLNYLWEGERRRATGTTGSNRRSSRSHAIWTLYLTSSLQSDGEDGAGLVTRTNQVHLVDLAGSEKADLITTKNLLAEGKDINRSLVTLGNVISSLAEKALYIPYRDSTLTFLLKDSLGGNSSTSIIITASPASGCYAQTLNSFRFAQRARLVENQPRIGTFQPVNGSGNIYGSMSGTEFRKDISRLATLIRSAQTNGGILRGLTSKQSWNRLIAAIENWSHNDKQAVERQKQFLHEASEDTSASSSSMKATTSISASTMTSSFSSDAMVQAEIKDDVSSSISSSNTSLSNTQSKVVGTEVFIPCSSTIKCLAWKQEEVQKLPRNPSSDSSDTTDSYASPPTSPVDDAKINHLKYLLKVNYPTMHCVSAESRMGEKIHGSVPNNLNEFEEIQLTPVEVTSDLEESPIVRERFPTLIAENTVENVFEQLSLGESSANSTRSGNCSSSISSDSSRSETTGQKHSTPIHRPGSISSKHRNRIPQFGFKIPKVSEFTPSRPVRITPFESTDEYEDDIEPESNINCEFGKYRAVSFHNTSKRAEIRRESLNEEEISDISDSEASSASSSSYQSLVIKSKSHSGKVKTIETGTFDFSSLEEKLDEAKVVKPVSPLECHQAKICNISGNCDDSESSNINLNSHRKPKIPIERKVLDCSQNTKFRTHFVKELDQMESIGKQIQNLRLLTQRHHVVKPYLDKIIELQAMDHREPDPILDAEIEECSGWNVNIELAKVQRSVIKLNKVLKPGVNTVACTNNSTTHSNSESGTSTNSCSLGRSDSISKLSPKSSPCSSNSSNASKEREGFKARGPTSLPLNLQLQAQQLQQPKRKLVVSPPVMQRRQSWHLQFPMSSTQQQQAQEMSHEYYQFPQQPASLPYMHSLSSPQQFINPFVHAGHNQFPPSPPTTSPFKTFHPQAQQRLAQRWEPILPKTSSYLHRTQAHCTGVHNNCAEPTPERISGCNNIGSHFHPSYQPPSSFLVNTTNPALLYPTNFPFQHQHQQQSPPKLQYNPGRDYGAQAGAAPFANTFYQTTINSAAAEFESKTTSYLPHHNYSREGYF